MIAFMIISTLFSYQKTKIKSSVKVYSVSEKQLIFAAFVIWLWTVYGDIKLRSHINVLKLISWTFQTRLKFHDVQGGKSQSKFHEWEACL